MPTPFSANLVRDWIRSLLRPLRVPIVFVMSALVSYCGFQELGVVGGRGGLGPARDGSSRLHVTLWNADLVGNGQPLAALPESIRSFADDLRPDILVVYQVPDFDTLKRLRDRLGLYGYTMVMSNFTCGGKAGNFKWPIEIAILSRFPIDRATEYDPAPDSLANCPQRGPFTDGPVHAGSAQMVPPEEVHMAWPAMRTNGRTQAQPGPGFLTAIISARRTAVVAVKVPTHEGYGSVGAATLGEMRSAITAAAGGWVWKEKDVHPDYKMLVMGDFGAQPGNHVELESGLEAGIGTSSFDAVKALLTTGMIDTQASAGPGHARGLRMLDLTYSLVIAGVTPGQEPHSDRIYLWSENPGSFGPVTRGNAAYGSRSYPISVTSSGVSCAIDPFLQWLHTGGVAQQIFAAMKPAVQGQLDAMRASGDRGKWVVVMKLDDLITDNTPLLYRRAQKCQFPTPEDWTKWIEERNAPLIPGAASFIAKVRALAADGRGRIVVLTDRTSQSAQATESYLREKFPDAGKLFDVQYDMTFARRQAAYAEIARSGARILAVFGNRLEEFPTDPALPVGGTDKSCPLPDGGDGSLVFGPQTARFGVCYALLPEAAR